MVPVVSTEQILQLRAACESVFVDPLLVQHAVRLAAATRTPESFGIADIARYIVYGASPRASINLIIAGTRARLRARPHLRHAAGRRPTSSHDVMRHRIIPSYEALSDGVTTDAIIQHVDDRPSPPRRRRSRQDVMPQQQPDPERILQRLDWTVIRRLDGLLQGDYRTLFRGFGLELAELREYQLTDDVRSIDWNVTARMQTPYVRQFMEDREITAWFLLDMSPSVDFGARGAAEA